MPENSQSLSQSSKPWEALARGDIVGASLLDLTDWFVKSSRTVEDKGLEEGVPKLLLPSIQRSAVWGARQVLDLWDSVLRGLPIGSFYVLKRSSDRKERTIGSGPEPSRRTVEVREEGYALLDGQQRMRALLAGLTKSNEEKRCVWINFSKVLKAQSSDTRAPYLLLTSKAQPFGYDTEKGRKLLLEQRRTARSRLGKLYNDAGKDREAYDHELFDESIYTENGTEIERQLTTWPQPFDTSSETTVPLWRLVEAYRTDSGSSFHEKVERMYRVQSVDIVERVRNFISRIENAKVALICIDMTTQGRLENEQRDLAALFTRIGTGGTQLSPDERLFSIYKHYVPEAHDLVESIHNGPGRMLPGVKIAGTALRIANVRASKPDKSGNITLGTPDEQAFIKAMTDGKGLQNELEKLLPSDGGQHNEDLALTFQFLRETVSGQEGSSDQKSMHGGFSAAPFWVPDVLLASLPAELWQVLAFWAVQNAETRCPNESREEMVRFILFWQLCVQDHGKASDRVFEEIAKAPSGQVCFPGRSFYRHLADPEGGDAYAFKLVTPGQLSDALLRACLSRAIMPEPGRALG